MQQNPVSFGGREPFLKFPERIAKHLIEHHVAGARMVYRPSQAKGEVDFDLFHSDGEHNVVEVASAVNRKSVESRKAITDAKKGGVFIPALVATNSWYIHLEPSARVNDVRQSVDVMIAAVEATGATQFFAPTDSYSNAAVRRIWIELGVQHGRVTEWMHGRYIGLGTPGQFTWVSSAHIVKAVQESLSKADNIRKLSPDDSTRSQFFLWIDHSSFDAWAAMERCLVPEVSPQLPGTATDVWVAAMTGPREAIRVFHFGRGVWRDLGISEVPASVCEQPWM